MTDRRRKIVGGIDAPQELHVAAVVAHRDRLIAIQSFPTTRQAYLRLLAWMRSFGEVERGGVESTGGYGAGVLRFLGEAGVEVLEVTAPDRSGRRRRGKNDDLAAENAAHAAYPGARVVTPRTRDGMVESLRILKVCRRRAVAARRVALQMIRNAIVCPPPPARPAARHGSHAADPDPGGMAPGSRRVP